MNKRSSQLFEQIVLALCGRVEVELWRKEPREVAAIAAMVITTHAQAIVERVEAIEAEAK